MFKSIKVLVRSKKINVLNCRGNMLLIKEYVINTFKIFNA